MKKIYFLFFLIIAINSSKAQWETVYWIEITPPLPNLNSVAFKDIYNGMTAGYTIDSLCIPKPVIIRTSDSGTNWDTVFISNSLGIFEDVILVNSMTAIAVGYIWGSLPLTNGIIAKTNDFGNTWDTLIITEGLNSIHFPSPQIGYAVGKNGSIIKTYNGGQSWVTLNPLPVQNNHSVFFINETVGFVGGDSIIFKTTDGGINWTISHVVTGYVLDVQFTSALIGYARINATPAELYKTIDGGTNWIQIATIAVPTATSIFFVNDTLGYITSIFNIRNTNDGGFTWTAQSSSPPSWGMFFDWVADVYFVNDTVGYAVGNGQFYRTFNGGGLLALNTNEPEPFFKGNINVYPNPVSNTALINIENRNSSTIEISIYNSFGQKVKFMQSHKSEIEFSRGGLTSGIYFVSAFSEGKLIGSTKFIID